MSSAVLNGHHHVNDEDVKYKNDIDRISVAIKPSIKLLTEFRANNYDHVSEVANFVRSRLKHKKPEIGLICGTGLGKIANYIEDPDVIAYGDIPGFPISTVHGHKGNFIFGKFQGKIVACMQGRIHLYEGYKPDLCTLPVRLMHLLGVHTLIVTNAAGGLNETFTPGDLMLIKDHLYLPGFAGRSPLMGPNDDRFGPRFPCMTNAYDTELRKVARKAAKEIGIKLQEGVYAMLGGPQFETPAENRFFRALGADVIGMSTAHEVIIARHCNMKVIGISLVTNISTLESDSDEVASDLHAEVLSVGEESSEKATKFMTHLIKNL